MNLNDLITFTMITSNVNVSKLTETNNGDFIIGFAHTMVFLDNYYLEITNIELALAVKKPSKVPQSLPKGKINIDKYEDGEIINQDLGVVFRGNNRNGKMIFFCFKLVI